jgi:hypothetical protein
VPVWCDRSATLSAINIRLKWMKRLWVGGQEAKDAVITTKQRSLEPLRRVRDGPPPRARSRKRIIYAGRLRLRLVQDRGAKELTKFVQENVANGAVERTDGWKAYDDLQMLGYTHEPLVLDGDPERTEAHLPMIHIAFSNLKTWLLGTHHTLDLTTCRYLNEFVFRFNRRFYPMMAFSSALGLAAHASAPTYKNLYSGDWTHPAS